MIFAMINLSYFLQKSTWYDLFFTKVESGWKFEYTEVLGTLFLNNKIDFFNKCK